MAVGNLTFTDNIATAVWTAETGTGGWVRMDKWADKTIAFTGTGTVALQGSMDQTNTFTCRDNTGTGITALAANTPAVVLDNPIYIRPVVTGGTATIYITGARGG